jgi:hypothetical protein
MLIPELSLRYLYDFVVGEYVVLLVTTTFYLLAPNLLTYKGRALNILDVSVITVVK